MSTETQAPHATTSTSKGMLWTGRVLSGLAVLFLTADAVAKVVKAAPVLEACAELEIPEWVIPRLGLILLVATVIYAIPRTAVLGAILLTGYLGGATWTHVRLGGPVFPIVFPSLVAAIVVWGGLFLRDSRLRALILPPRP